SWLSDKAPRTYRMILDADKFSAQRYSGHGSAMAQVYNHLIMPLANTRDALTQIRRGIAHFEFRYGRKPEGMWLAATAVNRSVLDLMAQEGIKFTVLAPAQCARGRKISAESSDITSDPPHTSAASPNTPADASLLSSRSVAGGSASSISAVLVTEEVEAEEITWTETPNATVDPTHPYVIRLNEGRSISVFFYDGPASRTTASSSKNFLPAGRRKSPKTPPGPASTAWGAGALTAAATAASPAGIRSGALHSAKPSTTCATPPRRWPNNSLNPCSKTFGSRATPTSRSSLAVKIRPAAPLLSPTSSTSTPPANSPILNASPASNSSNSNATPS